MNRALHILLLNDNPDDRALVARELCREIPNLQVEHIIQATDFDQAVKAGAFDLVITDLQLCWTDGLKVLHAVKSCQPDCPVIMFTNASSEEIAVEAMKAGLDDYVVKSSQHSVRLRTAVRSVLEKARHRRAQREADDLYRDLFERAPVAIYRITPEGQILKANPAMMQMLGCLNHESLIGVDVVGTLVDAEEYARWKMLLEQEGAVSDYRGQMRRFDGTLIWVESNARVVRDNEGQVLYYEGAIVDITERKRAEERIRNEAARAGALARVAARLNAQLDLDAVLDAICKETAQALAVPVVSVTLYDARDKVFRPAAVYGLQEMPGEFIPFPWRIYDEYVQPQATGERRNGPLIILPDLQTIPDLPNVQFYTRYNLRTTVAAGMTIDEEVIGTLNIQTVADLRTFSDEELALLKGLAAQAAVAVQNARLFEQVREQREQLRVLGARLAEVEEAERQRMARELHDQVGQNLTALGINLNIMRTQLSEAADAIRSRLDDSLLLVEQTTERVRNVMAELRPPVLDDYGLLAALRWYGEQFSARTGLAIDVQGAELDPRLAAPTENALFRIAQEALTNVTRHAHATRVAVKVNEPNSNVVQLVITDNGIGFEPARPAEPGGQQPWGLISMTERAEAVNGRCHIESQPGQGTRLIVEVPR
jgi:PAS domain S-box-containing protein